MKRPTLRDVPPYAAIAIVAMALLATLVSGREQSAPSYARQPGHDVRVLDASPLALDLDALVREAATKETVDLFATPAPAAPPPPPVPVKRTEEPLPAPVAPPLPFTYSGRILKGDHYYAYLLRKDELFVAEAGETIADEYRVEGITEDVIHFLYLPLGIKQVLNIPQSQ